eukprot:gnl/MRDRNA2_/MRDRNA2_105828_c0_seq1.p1 gnl/MRDRNA2_/MRDRNA2_105828_c0~~gnl/MRDRNA2_/MRDRNA2_105828_c0_seq1.p1  ORF type:complete len:836 (+),score=113.95 gnl/MRDRNA2_/MRDRNA2_105828_c0_seq1:352-2508(+)
MASPGIPAGARAQTPRPGPQGRALTTPRTIQQSESTVKLNGLNQEAPSPIPSAWANDFQINSEAPSLGGGAFAEVYRVEHKRTRVQYAIKVMHWPNFHLRGIEAQIDAEIRAMALAAQGWKNGEENHIVRMLRHTDEGEYVFVLLELCGQGDILRQLSAQSSGKFPEWKAAKWALHLFLGLKNIHSLGVIHRDIKPDNLLCCDDGTLKIADFGWCAEQRDKPTALAGTFQYMAPEVLKNQTQTEAVDVWSAGATLFQLMTGRALLQTYLGPGATNLSGTNPHEATRIKQSWLIREIEENCPPHKDKKPDDLSLQCWDFLRGILHPDTQKRATVAEALRHPWLGNQLMRESSGQSQLITPSSAPSLEPSPEPAIMMSPDRRSNASIESVEKVPTPTKERSHVPGRNNAYSPPLDKSKGSPLSKRSISASPRREIGSPIPALAGRRRTPGATEPLFISSLETSSRSVPPITRRNSGRNSLTQEVTPYELESRLGRASSLSDVQGLSCIFHDVGQEMVKLSSLLSGNSALQSLPDRGTTSTSRPAYAYDSLLATAPSISCDRTRSPGPSKARTGEVFTPCVRKGETSPIRVHTHSRSNWQADSNARRTAVPTQPVSTWLYASGYPMDVLSKSMNPRNATAAAPRECRTPMVPLHPVGLREVNVPTQPLLLHQTNQTMGHQTVTYLHDVHWQTGAAQQPQQRIQRRRETLGGAWPPPQVARY